MRTPDQVENELDKIEKLIQEMKESYCEYVSEKELERISKIMNKGCPTLKVGEFTIKYQQVPYVDRYIFVFINDMYDKQIIKMKKDLFLQLKIFQWFNAHPSDVTIFLGKIQDFDDKMDSGKDNIKTWMDK